MKRSDQRRKLLSRREVLAGGVAATGAAFAVLPGCSSPSPAAPAVEPGFKAAQRALPTTAKSGNTFTKIEELSSAGGKLRGTITMRNQNIAIPNFPQPVMLRYMEGKDAGGKIVWPPAPASGSPAPYRPGPTLRARIGERVNLSLMNHINANDFNGAIDIAETGKGFCDTVRAGDPPAVIYPDPMKETPPNCFHASSTSNLHFHGTHVSPNGLGDNIFVQLRPNLKVTDESVKGDFTAIFNAEAPTRWNQLPEHWRREQIRLLEEYNKTAPYVDANGKAKRGLPPDLAIPVPKLDQAEFPDFLIGAYPYNFLITPDPAGPNPQKYQMGQVPGTHWYHAHKHGSTATNLYNGLAGAFIIEGDYDDALVKIYPDLKKTEKVLVVQEAKEKPNLERQGNTPNARVVNGDLNPVIEMKQGEIQLWRFINAGVGQPIALSGFTAATAGAPLPVVKQTAQDGVQFNWDNFTKQPLLTFAQNFAPGNRIDWLVQAPNQEGTYTLQVGTTALLTLAITKDKAAPAMQFPTKDNYPKFPSFLADIKDPVKKDRPPLVFGWEDGRIKAGGPPPAPHFMINGKQFSGDRPPDQIVTLGDAEEWTLVNTTAGIYHPFHIHVNPFQVVESFDPSKDSAPQKVTDNAVWWDTIAIPPSIYDPDTKKIKEPAAKNTGYVKIRSRFVDFAGMYVLHCHMLAHEDRGMMQTVQVLASGEQPASKLPHRH